jgi:hypothetical protein
LIAISLGNISNTYTRRRVLWSIYLQADSVYILFNAL